MYWKFYHKKNEIFQITNSDIFSYFCSKYRLSVLVRTASPRRFQHIPESMFLNRNKKNNVYPCKPQFYHIKVGLRGLKLYRHVFVIKMNAFERYEHMQKIIKISDVSCFVFFLFWWRWTRGWPNILGKLDHLAHSYIFQTKTLKYRNIDRFDY